MWKKILVGLGGVFLALRWSRRFYLAWRVGGRSAGHLSPTLWGLGAYVAVSGALLFGFWRTEGRWSLILALAFVALQIASISALWQMR